MNGALGKSRCGGGGLKGQLNPSHRLHFWNDPKVYKKSLPFCHRHKKEAKKARQNDASARSSQSGNRLTKVAEVVNFVVDYPDCPFTPVQGPPILSCHRSSAKAFF